MITKFKIFEESEVTAGNATGKSGTPSLPFGRGFYQSGGNDGSPGVTFTPKGEPSFKSFKDIKHSKKNLLQKKKRKEFLAKIEKEKDEKL